jgi:hypothetical protein
MSNYCNPKEIFEEVKVFLNGESNLINLNSFEKDLKSNLEKHYYFAFEFNYTPEKEINSKRIGEFTPKDLVIGTFFENLLKNSLYFYDRSKFIKNNKLVHRVILFKKLITKVSKIIKEINNISKESQDLILYNLEIIRLQRNNNIHIADRSTNHTYLEYPSHLIIILYFNKYFNLKLNDSIINDIKKHFLDWSNYNTSNTYNFKELEKLLI